MNKIIRLASPKTDEEIRECIKRVVEQLEKFNYANSSNGLATRIIGKSIPKVYKKNNIIQIKSGIIIVSPLYYIEKKAPCSIRIRPKSSESSAIS